jgi:hypothetical protein
MPEVKPRALTWRQNARLEFLNTVDAAARLLSGKFYDALLTTAEEFRSQGVVERGHLRQS